MEVAGTAQVANDATEHVQDHENVSLDQFQNQVLNMAVSKGSEIQRFVEPSSQGSIDGPSGTTQVSYKNHAKKNARSIEAIQKKQGKAQTDLSSIMKEIQHYGGSIDITEQSRGGYSTKRQKDLATQADERYAHTNETGLNSPIAFDLEVRSYQNRNMEKNALQMANSAFLLNERQAGRQKSQKALEPSTQFELDKLKKQLLSRQERSELNNSSRSNEREAVSEFVPFFKERSSMGRLLSLENGKQSGRKMNKQFALSKQNISYLNRDFQKHQMDALLEASAKISQCQYTVSNNKSVHPKNLLYSGSRQTTQGSILVDDESIQGNHCNYLSSQLDTQTGVTRDNSRADLGSSSFIAMEQRRAHAQSALLNNGIKMMEKAPSMTFGADLATQPDIENERPYLATPAESDSKKLLASQKAMAQFMTSRACSEEHSSTKSDARSQHKVDFESPELQNLYITAVDPTNRISHFNHQYESSEYVPQHHLPLKQLSVKKIRGQIGRRLDGEQQMITNLAKSMNKKRVMDLQKESLQMVPRTRDMPHYKKTTTLPGPEVYSLKAAKVCEELRTKGSDRRSTVDLSRMRGGRSGFIFQKHRKEYEQNYHHQVQIGNARSSLSQTPEIKIEKQLDRDSTSIWKEQFMFFNKVRDDKARLRIARNHEETLMNIKVDQYIALYGNQMQLMPDELRMYVKDGTGSIGHHNAHKMDDRIVEKNLKSIQDGKNFKKRVQHYVYEQQMAMYAERS